MRNLLLIHQQVPLLCHHLTFQFSHLQMEIVLLLVARLLEGVELVLELLLLIADQLDLI